MSRTIGTLAGLLGLLLAGALPAVGQWKGERCAPQQPQDGAEFGSAVAVSDDGTIAVGDYRNDVVYLFDRDSEGRCKQSGVIRGSEKTWFGFALAIDGKKLVVGAPKARGTGEAYLYDVTNPLVIPDRKVLTMPQAQSGDEIGSSVAIAGNNLAIGARGADGRRGRVYFSTGGAFERALIDGLAPNSELGQSVALSGTTLVMGAPSPYRSSGSPGAAWVFELGSPAALPLTPPGGLEPEAAFGYAVAVDGDRILVGAPLADGAGVDAGAVFGFSRRDNGTWELVPQPVLLGERGDQLGIAVALDAENAVIGARFHDDARGGAYLVEASGDVQSLQPDETLPTEAQFGSSVAVRGGTAVVGAFRQTPGGAAYRFDAPPVEKPPVTVRFAVASSDVLESAGTVSLSVTVQGPPGRLNERVTGRLTILEGGTARDGRDFRLAGAGSFDIPAGTLLPHTLTKAVEILKDDVREMPETFRVQLSEVSSATAEAPGVHTVTIHDFPLMVTAGPLQTSELGDSTSLQIRLAVQPDFEVNVSLRSRDSGEGSVPSELLTLNSTNWESGLPVKVTGQDDALCDGRQRYEIVATTTSTDPLYKDLEVFIPAENADDELACLAFEKTACQDQGGTVVYTIALFNEASGVPDAPAELQDILPSGITVVTASADRGVATADPVANSVRWNGTVPAARDEAVTITIVAALDDLLGPVPANLANLFYVRDGRGHRETREIVFSAADLVPCPP